MTAVAVDPLVCSICGKGPFMDARALGGHRVAHETVECSICGKTVNRRGLGPHNVGHRAARRKAAPVAPEVAALLDLLGRLVGVDAVGRLRSLLDRVEGTPLPGSFVVIADEWGPYLTNRLNVGQVVERSREACVVIPVGLAIDLAHNTQRRLT